MKRIGVVGGLMLALGLVGCGGSSMQSAKAAEANMARIWTDELLEAIRTTSYGPPANSRAIGIVSTAMYDAYAMFDPVAVGVYTVDEDLVVTAPASEMDEAVAYAAYGALMDLFPSRASQFTARMNELGFDPNVTAVGLDTGAGVGNLAADNVIAGRANDGSNQAGNYADTTGYTPMNTVDTVNDPNRWQPVEFTLQGGAKVVPGFLSPHWGGVTPFALASGAEFRCPVPAQFGSAEYASEVQAIIDYQANLTDEQKMVAEYWADGPNSETPPGHAILLAQHLARRNSYGLGDSVKLYFLVGNAVMDAGIAAWDSKVAHDYVRPITAIRHTMAGQQIMGWRGVGQGMGMIDGSEWKPYQPEWFVTPPFAEMPSGHSTFTSAAASVMRSYQGSDALDFTEIYTPGSSGFEPGVTPGYTVVMSYPTLSSAAYASGISRLYGGIHFPKGNSEGQKMGNQVGEKVWEKASRLFEGVR